MSSLERRTLWNVDSSQLLKDKKSDLLSGGGCNVVAYLSSALKRAQAGSAVEWNTAVDISPQVDMFSRSSHWFSPNGEAPWCSDGGATTDSQWPDGSIPFDSVLDPNEEDALMIVMGRALKKAQHSTRVSY